MSCATGHCRRGPVAPRACATWHCRRASSTRRSARSTRCGQACAWSYAGICAERYVQGAMPEPVFYYDFNSPFAYIAAHRVDDVLPVRARWRPIAFAFLLIAHQREPWSFDVENRGATMRDCERRAAELGLPLQWPDGWPQESYSLLPLRASVLAEREGLLREFSRAAFRRHFSEPDGVRDLDGVLAAAAEAGLDPDEVRAHVGDDDVKQVVKDATDAAIELGVFGVPTVQVSDELFWGDDRLEEAAAALELTTG